MVYYRIESGHLNDRSDLDPFMEWPDNVERTKYIPLYTPNSRIRIAPTEIEHLVGGEGSTEDGVIMHSAVKPAPLDPIEHDLYDLRHKKYLQAVSLSFKTC
jgi:hypothetical protein